MRRTLLVIVGCLALPVAAAGEPIPTRPGAGGVVDRLRPNVIVIMTDDQDVESLRAMPNVRRLLARQGTTFQNAFASFPLCCPSRATLLTGQYAHNHGVLGNAPPNGGYHAFDPSSTLATWLQQSGYATALVGKYLNGYGEGGRRFIPPGWDEWHAGVRLGYVGHSMTHDGRIRVYRSDRDYVTDVYTRTAVNLIARRARDTRPFFLWLSYFAPHIGSPRDLDDPDWPFRTPSPAPRHRDLYASELLRRSPSFNELDVSDKPATIRSLPLLSPDHEEALREVHAQRLESLLAVDEGVAAVVEELRRRGVLDRTLIIFTSDNGFLLGEHRIGTGKIHLYEPSIRVPLIVRGPGVPRGRVLSQPVANVDLAPTILASAHTRPLLPQDGRSLWPLLSDPLVEWGRDLLIERGPGADGAGDRLFTAIRTPSYLYAEHANGEHELYDLRRDPDQLESLHAEPSYAPVRAELAGRLAELRDCSGVVCRRGPAVRLSFGSGMRCIGSSAVASVAGADERLVSYVEYLIGEQRVARADAAPFTATLSRQLFGRSGTASVRARVALDDGRAVTLDRAAPLC